MYTCVCGYAHSLGAYVEARDWNLKKSFPLLFLCLFFFLKQDLSLNLEPAISAKLSVQLFAHNPPVSVHQCWNYRLMLPNLAYYMGAEDANSGLPGFTFPTEPLPEPLEWNYSLSLVYWRIERGSRILWWMEWERLPWASYIWMLGPLVVELFGKD